VPRRMFFDRWLIVTCCLLVVGGLFLVASASHYAAMSRGLSPSYFLWKHAVHVALGIVVLAVASYFPYRRLSEPRIVVALLAVTFVSLLFVLAMPAAGGAHRWFRLPFFAVQPSEFAKIVCIVFTASLLARKEAEVNDPKAVPFPCLAVIGTFALLVAIEPDLGSAVMLAVPAAAMLFATGLSYRHIGATAGLGVVGVVAAILVEPYRMERVKSFLDPTADTLGSGFQLTQSLIAVGSGGIAGVGLGEGKQKAFFLPEPHTDFIFSVIGEELGVVGTLLVLVAFLLLFWRGMRAAWKAPDRFSSYLALGLTCSLVLQGLIHMGVCVGLLPTKGLPLPFVSYGGSSLLATMAMAGLLLNVSQHSN
jgi:cell division protein FtsW